MISFRPEGALVLNEGPTYDLALQIKEWITDTERKAKGWVAAVYGGRGSGKTSLLLTLKKLLEKNGNDVVLPKMDGEEALFSVSQTRIDHKLFALFVEFLERAYGEPEILEKVKQIDMRWQELRQFVQYQKDMASDEEDMVKRLTEAYAGAARSTTELKKRFSEVLKRYQTRDLPSRATGRTLVLLVDDLDLQPHRALELLEIFLLFLNVAGVVVVLAADRDLLLHNIDGGLKDKKTQEPGLAGSLLGKLVPYSWMLPLPTPQDRLRELWRKTQSGEEPELPRWWSDLATTDDPENLAREHLGPLLPPTYRGLKALHNRLISLRQEILRSAGEPDDRQLSQTFGESYSRDLGLLAAHLPAAFSTAAAIDVRWPVLGILEALIQTPKEFTEALTVLAPPPDEGEASAPSRHSPLRALSPLDQQLPVLDRLNKQSLAGRELGEARRLLGQMAAVWAEWRDLSARARPARRFLAVSVDNDAKQRAEILWKERYRTRPADLLHLDLQRNKDPQRENLARQRAARMDAHAYLTERKLGSQAGGLELRAEAPLSLLVWIGWHLRYVETAAYNFFSGNFVPYNLPPRQPFLDRHKFEVLQQPEEGNSEPTEENELILLLDTLGRSNEQDLDRFVDAESHPLSRWYRARLQTPAGWTLTEEGLVALMQDVIEYLGQMKQEYDFRRIHLGLVVPDVVALALGRQLNAWPVCLYEFNKVTNQYQYVFDLTDPVP